MLLVALAVLAGLVGVVVPVLPGLLLVWGAVAVWAIVEGRGGGAGSGAAWTLLAGATVLAVVSQVVKYAVPGRALQRAGVPNQTLLIGGLAGLAGFFIVPVVGLPLGFVAAIYVAERRRLRSHPAARSSTVHALKAVGLSILLELAAALLIAVAWVGALVA